MKKYRNLGSLIITIVFALFLVACSEESEKEVENKPPAPPSAPAPHQEEKKERVHSTDEYSEEKVKLQLSQQDKKYLSLVDSFPLGTNYDKIQGRMNLKGARPESGSTEPAGKGLTEAKTKVDFLGKPTDVEFNFKNDSLYSFYYTTYENDFTAAERLYKGIQQYYIKKYGACEEPVTEEETKLIRNCYWREKSPYGVLTYNVNTGMISWGFQNSKP